MPTWEDVFQQREWGQWPDTALVRFYRGSFRQSWAAGEPPNVLEIGAGAGANLWFLAREGANVSGIDISETAIALARKKLDVEAPDWCGTEPPESRLYACSATSLPFTDSSFDLVVDVECLAHLDWNDARLAIQEAYRVARPGARMFCRMLDDNNALTGEPGGTAGLIEVTSGVLHGMPPMRLLPRSEIVTLLDPWEVTAVDQEAYTIKNGSARMSEHIVWAQKAPECDMR